VWVGGLQVIRGEITIGNIAEYIIYVTIMTWPVAALGFVLNMIQRADASMGRLCEVLDTEPGIADGPTTDRTVTQLDGSVAFRNVTYRYEPDGPPVLDDVSFEIPAGATLGIVGRTGSGKSTLVRMLPRLIDPDEGAVEIGGRNVREVPVDVLRSTMGYVPQEAFLFSETVGENIAFSSPGATEESIRAAADRADLTANVEEFPEGFQTMVGERGVTLSGGQKQRAAIARALLPEPRVVIFDDALSAVDAQTEENILVSLRKIKGRQTLVIVSHRLSAVQDADLIIVLEEGRVQQRGSHKDLLREPGLYADLWKRQQLEEEIKAL